MSRPTDPHGPAGRALPAHLADSAGQPWAGRHFDDNAHTADDGSAPEAFAAAVEAFLSGDAGEVAVVDAFRDARFLIPLIAHLGEAGENEDGVMIDKKQELSIVTVHGPDGRSVLPVFSSVAAMAAWNPRARPVPADGGRVALAAAGEQTDLVVVDPTTPGEFALRRPALWAVARSEPWIPSYLDPAVADAIAAGTTGEPSIRSVRLESGDPSARLHGPETTVVLGVEAGLDREALTALLGRVSEHWGSEQTIADRVDSLAIKVVGE